MSASRRKSKGGRPPPPPPPETSSPLPSAEGAPVASAGLTLAASEAQDQADEKIPRTYRRSVVQLALNNMKLANICIGRPVLLTSNNGKQEVCTAWPVAGFPGGKIGLSKITQKNLKVGSGDAITVQPVTGPLLQAEEVELKRRAKDDCVNGDELSASILRSLDGKVVLPGNTLEVTFYGRSCDLMVTNVKGTDGGILRMQNNSLLRPSEEVSLENIDTDHSDLSVQLGQLLIEDDQGGISASTPCKQMDHSISINSSKDTMEFGELSSDLNEAPLSGDTVVTSIPHFELSRLESNDRCFASDQFQQANERGMALNSDTFYFISSRTRIHFTEAQRKPTEECIPEPKVTYDSIGGLSSQLKSIREMIELPLKQPDLFRRYGRMSVLGVSCYKSL